MDENAVRTNEQPVHKLRYGNVSLAVWANNSPAGYFYNTTCCKAYKNGNGEWCETASFDDRDLPNLSLAAADVHAWIQQQKQNAVTMSGTKESTPDDSEVV